MDTKGAFGQSVGLAIVSEHVDDAIVASVGGDLPGEKANAHLIAAAPDLLAVCASIVEEHAVWVDADDWSDAPSRSDLIESIAGLVEDARAAIAKADGRP